MVAEEINDFLKSVNSDERISHQSYRARGILKQPTVHLGNNAWHELRRTSLGTRLDGRSESGL